MSKRPYCEADTECANNWWLLKLYTPMGPMVSFELHPHKPQLYDWEISQLRSLMQQFTLVGFNWANYDDPMVRLALSGVGVYALKSANDHIIMGGLKRWEFDKAYPMALKGWLLRDEWGYDHIDIMEVVPGVKISLKTYMARQHSPTIQDLPFDPSADLDEAGQTITRDYCGNDLQGTRQLRENIMSRLRLREKLTEKLTAELAMRRTMADALGIAPPEIRSVDLRSKSDAQMSEAIIAAKLGYRPDVPYIPSGHSFMLKPAPWLQFVTPEMQQVFELCKRVVFKWHRNDEGEHYIDAEGKKVKTGVSMPPELKTLKVRIGDLVPFKFGIGGLHSTESAQTLYSVPGVNQLSDHDVGSFYPSLAILLALFGPQIMPIYREIYDERMANKGRIDDAKAALEAAAECDKATLAQILDEIETVTSGLKIVLNGGYGKLWSKYSFLLDPEAGVAITINGQLSLLMLIERLYVGGVRTVSANTDGIVINTPAGLEWWRDSTLAWWEKTTGLTTDRTVYRSIHSRDVNSYVAVKPDGKAKRKGVFCESGILASMQGVHPDRDISKDAAVAYITHGTPISDTVRGCTDIRKFIRSRAVKGGGQWQGHYLGKTVRWYYGTGGSEIRGVSSNNKVADSDGAVPVQKLPDVFPADVDYSKYEDYARELLAVAGTQCP